MSERAERVLREFVADVDAAYPDAAIEQLQDEWPDLVVTYDRAVAALVALNTPEKKDGVDSHAGE